MSSANGKGNSKATEQAVTEYIRKLPPSVAKSVVYLRKVILSADKEVGEHIKWNSPAFYYTGEIKPFDPKEYKRDIMVMNLRNKEILLVLPTGGKLKNSYGLLEGEYADGRKLIRFKDLDDIKAKEKSLVSIIQEWVSLVEK